MPPPARVTAEDVRALVDGLSDLSVDTRRLGDKHGDNTAELKAVRTGLENLATSVARLERLIEKQQDSGHFIRALSTFEKASWQSVTALLVALVLFTAVTVGHVDLVALVAAYSHPKGSP